ncbi:hypothetical protein F503_01139 [Ophiostoma piceae UAMH 11346]|uniref:Uncharacterized protein n=1 Tax=Ophiostoma piceae (strain UAMH 11346) TaxID=1262450 RepID=S3C8T6_OPHP1|nr:hypothetical protein F503_01139 [Ophiostoma piceae UAMH 11346]
MTTTLAHTSVLLLLGTLFSAQPAVAQSQATGDLSLAAPYGIPPDLFNKSSSRTAKQSSVYIPGYNLSAPEGSGSSGNGSAVNGWQLGVAVAENVPLREASAPGIDKADVIDAITLWLQAPPGVGRLNATAWKLCATVFPFVNMSAVNTIPESSRPKGQNDGSCGPWVTDQCAAALNEVGVVFGVTDDGACYDVTVPHSCLPYFQADKGNGTAIPLDEKTLADGRFYAWGSLPTTRDDTAALQDALGHVWPVLLTWVQFSPSGKVFSANTYISCIVADGNGTGSAIERGSTFSAGVISNVASWPPHKTTWVVSVAASIAYICLR